MDKRIENLIATSINSRLSDIHISGGQPLIFRRDGIIHRDKGHLWTPRQIDDIVRGMLNDKQLKILKRRWSVDLAFFINDVRVRINVFSTTRGLSLAIRILPEIIPNLEVLNLHPSLNEIQQLHQGLVLVCGTTGSGKSTTVAAIVEEINRNRQVHILTIEDPIEYRFQNKKAFIEQREVGVHVPSFRQGLLDALRENPDVIFVGELREPETIRLTVNAAVSGHLVFATIHATDVEDAVYRINNAVTDENQQIIRYQFASTLTWLIAQQLRFVERVGFRVPILAILRNTTPVRSTIRDNRTSQLDSIMQTGRGEGMLNFETYEREFIDARKSFVHPHQNFVMQSRTSREPDFNSALIDPLAIQNVVYTASVESEMKAEKPVAPAAPAEQAAPPDGDEGYVVLGDTEDLKDLIAQLQSEKPDRG
ncbi:MAG TPA: PilT/PilU family type 4a pilus ATPase [Desulfobacteraceae bacterium]|nr:PilT/PilU family type 4a pilus ATPase [Desulfobacteraceae bacterium]